MGSGDKRWTLYAVQCNASPSGEIELGFTVEPRSVPSHQGHLCRDVHLLRAGGGPKTDRRHCINNKLRCERTLVCKGDAG